MMGHRTALFFSGILSMVCARAANGPETDFPPVARDVVERSLAQAPTARGNAAAQSTSASLKQSRGQWDGYALKDGEKFHPNLNLVRLDGNDIDPDAAQELFSKVLDAKQSPNPADVVGCYEVLQSRLHTLNCMDALKGSLDPTSSRTYYVEIAGLPEGDDDANQSTNR